LKGGRKKERALRSEDEKYNIMKMTTTIYPPLRVFLWFRTGEIEEYCVSSIEGASMDKGNATRRY
jgi:hypothetical protein